MNNPGDDSWSMIDDEQDYARILKNCVENLKNQRERKMEGKMKILDLKFCYLLQMQLGFSLYTTH